MVPSTALSRAAMITRQRKRTPFRRLWMPLVTAGFLGYFGFHAFNGSFGIWAMDRLERDAKRLSAELGRLQHERESLEHRVAAIRPGSLDADAVDIAARTQLNLIRPDEVVLDLGAAQQSPD
jgi:cell division protein FtsB